MPSERTNNFPESVRGLGHVAPTILIDFVDVRTVRWPAPNIGRYLVRKKLSVSGIRKKINKLYYCYEYNQKVVYDHLITTRVSEI